MITTPAPDPEPAPVPAIVFNAVTKTYGPVRALAGVDLRVAPGEIVALLGPNGAGKSTAMEMMVGLATPDSGSVRILGIDPATATRTGMISTMLQGGALVPDQTVRSVLRMLHSLQAHPMSLADAIAQADIDDLQKRRISTLSGGQAQRVRFAIALLGDPQVLLLDEPTVGMDVGARRAFWQQMRAVAASGRTIVFATHHLQEAEREAARVLVMDRGRIVADGTGTEITDIVSGRVLTVRGVAADSVASLPGVATATSDEADPELVRAACTDSDAALRALLNSPDADAAHDIQVRAPGLEEAFLRITDHAQTDQAQAPLTEGAVR